MPTFTIPGNGIISGTFDTEELDRRREEQRKQEAEYDAAMRASATREAEQQKTIDEIETFSLLPFIKAELAEEMAVKTPAALCGYLEDCQRFKECAQRWDLDYLPATPQMVAVYLSEESEKGIEHVRRQVNAIRELHRATNNPDPTTDILVRAILRLCEKEDDKQKKGTN
jgi:hypothetical protein